MQRSRSALGFGVAPCLLALMMLAAAPGAGEQEPPAVDGAVEVTASPPGAARGYTAPAVAVAPGDDRTVVVAAADVYSGECTVRVSTDGGLRWRDAARPQVPAGWPNCTFVNFGPVVDVEFGPDGTLYYAFSGYDPERHKGRVFLARSEDLGASWDTTTLPWIEPDLDSGEAGIDAVPSIAIDPDDSQRVYVGWGSNWATYALPADVLDGKLYYWDVIERVYVAASTDGGETFSEPVDVGEGLDLAPGKEGVKPPPQVLVGNDGEVYAVFGEYSRAGTRDSREGEAPPAHIYLAVSRDGGATYTNRAIYTQPPPTESSAWTWVPRAGIDRANGTLYVVWEDMSHAGDPVQISVIRSTDGGESWSGPAQVNDAVPERRWNYPEAYPDLAVAPGGRVDIAWYDWRNDPAYDPEEGDNAFQDVYYSYSADGGQTWAANLRITDRAIDRRLGPWATGSVRGTLGLAALDSGAYLAWDDTRNGNETTQAQDVYFARVRLQDAGEFFSAAGTSPSWIPLVAVAGGGLAVAGLVLLAAMPAIRRSRRPAPARDGSTASRG